MHRKITLSTHADEDCQVAAKTASAFNPNVRITPIHGNIKEPHFDISWFKSFDLVLNALDNLGKLSPHGYVLA